MSLLLLSCLSNPMNWILILMLVSAWSRIFRRPNRNHAMRGRVARVGSGSSEALGAAALFLSTAYRPSQEFIAKTQIQQHEDAEDDDQGGPDTSRKHFLRQLRRIRRGEKVDRLTWFAETSR